MGGVQDTINLDANAKAQKPREAAVADSLLATCAPSLGLASDASGRAVFFEELLNVKTDQSMLLAFATRDLLRQDYKEEVMALRAAPGCAEGSEGDGAGGEGGGGTVATVGVGSVTVPLPTLIARQPISELQAQCAAYAAERSLDVLILMAVDLEARQRYLLLHCADASLRARALAAMEAGDVRLAPLDGEAEEAAEGEAAVQRAYTIGNYKTSRKVLMPLLRAM